MNIHWELLRFPFDDPKWQTKALIGGLLAFGAMWGAMCIAPLVLILPLLGYMVRVMRPVIKGEPPALPEWDEWGALFKYGLRVWVVGFVYNLPLLIFYCCIYAVMFLPVASIVITGEAGGEPSAAFMTSWFVSFAASFLIFGLMMLVSLPLAYLNVVAITRMVAEDSLGSAFQFKEVWKLGRRGFKHYLLAVIVFTGTLGIAYLLTMAIGYTICLSILSPILLGLLAFYSAALSGALFGQAYYHAQAEAKDAPVEGEAAAA